MEAIAPYIFDNLDIILSVCFMLYPFLSVLWESYTVGTTIHQQRTAESATLQQLVNQVEETAKKIDQLQTDTVAKNLLEKGQLEAMVKSNVALGGDIEYFRHTVEEEQTAIKELAKFMYEKNRVTDGLVMIANDHKKALEVINLDVLTLGGSHENMINDVNGAERDIQLLGEQVGQLKEGVKANAQTNQKQFKDVYTKLVLHQKSTDKFRAWVEGELKMLISNSSVAATENVNKDINVLKADLKHIKEYIGVMRDNLTNNSCNCGDKMERIEFMLKDQKNAIKDDYYVSEGVDGNTVDKLTAILQESYATRDEIQSAFSRIHEHIAAAQCNCNSSNNQQLQQQEQGSETSKAGSNPEGMVVDP